MGKSTISMGIFSYVNVDQRVPSIFSRPIQGCFREDHKIWPINGYNGLVNVQILHTQQGDVPKAQRNGMFHVTEQHSDVTRPNSVVLLASR